MSLKYDLPDWANIPIETIPETTYAYADFRDFFFKGGKVTISGDVCELKAGCGQRAVIVHFGHYALLIHTALNFAPYLESILQDLFKTTYRNSIVVRRDTA